MGGASWFPMSAEVLSALCATPGLTPSAVLVWCALRAHAGTSGEAWPSRATLERETNQTRSVVYRALRELENSRLIETVKESHGGIPVRRVLDPQTRSASEPGSPENRPPVHQRTTPGSPTDRPRFTSEPPPGSPVNRVSSLQGVLKNLEPENLEVEPKEGPVRTPSLSLGKPTRPTQDLPTLVCLWAGAIPLGREEALSGDWSAAQNITADLQSRGIMIPGSLERVVRAWAAKQNGRRNLVTLGNYVRAADQRMLADEQAATTKQSVQRMKEAALEAKLRDLQQRIDADPEDRESAYRYGTVSVALNNLRAGV